METINEKIKRLRKQSGISQIDVAKAAGINQASYSNIEKGETKSITIEVGKGIAKALGISFNEIFDIELSKENSNQLEQLEAENENLTKQLQEKQYLIDLLKNEKAHIKLYLLMRLFGRYENAIRFLETEILNSESEGEKMRLSQRRQLIDTEFSIDKNYYINGGIMTQAEFDEYFDDMKNIYKIVPDELNSGDSQLH